jgi:hypothetical protein
VNQEIYTIIEDMKRQKPKETARPDTLLNYQSVQMAQLLVLLAEESEKSAKTTEKLTGRILYLTWAIAILTAVLLITSFVEFPKISLTGYNANQFYQQTKQDQTNKPNENHK